MDAATPKGGSQVGKWGFVPGDEDTTELNLEKNGASADQLRILPALLRPHCDPQMHCNVCMRICRPVESHPRLLGHMLIRQLNTLYAMLSMLQCRSIMGSEMESQLCPCSLKHM